MLGSGAIMTFDLDTLIVSGLTYVGINAPSTMSVSDVNIGGIDIQVAVRIWVGTEESLSDVWDSGVINTSLTSMLYGGDASKLIAGQTYYVNIQTCSNLNGWGEVAKSTFTVPR